MASSQYFSGLFSTLSSKACVVLTTPPTFSGVSSATANADGSVSLAWSAATGVAQTPVRYRVYVASGSVSGATLFAGLTYMISSMNTTTFKVFTDASGTALVAGSVYTFGVRAIDSVGNMESNLAVATATITYNLYALVQSVPGLVWDQLKSAHTISGSYGAYLDAQVSLTQTAATALSQYNTLTTAIGLVQSAATALTQYNALVTNIGSPQQTSTALTQYTSIQSAIALVQTAATALSQYNALVSSLSAIPTNPLLTTDSRLNTLDVAISSRQSAATALSQYNTLVSNITSISASVWDVVQSGHVTSGTFGAYLNAQVSLLQTAATALTQFNTLVIDITAVPTNPLLTTDSRLNNLDATVSSRLATSGYTAPNNTGIAAIQAKTDNLPVDPAGETTSQEILTIVETLSAGDFSQSLVIPSFLSIPKTGSETYRLYWKHSENGIPTNPNVGPTMTIFEQDGTTPIVTATAMTNLSAGLFYYDYTVTPTAFVGEIIVSVTHKNTALSPLDTIIAQTREEMASNVDIQAIVDGVWNEPTSAHTTSGTFGENAQTPAINPTQVATAVWDSATSAHMVSGSFGLNAQTPQLTSAEVTAAVLDVSMSTHQSPGTVGAAIAAGGGGGGASGGVIAIVSSDSKLLGVIDPGSAPIIGIIGN